MYKFLLRIREDTIIYYKKDLSEYVLRYKKRYIKLEEWNGFLKKWSIEDIESARIRADIFLKNVRRQRLRRINSRINFGWLGIMHLQVILAFIKLWGKDKPKSYSIH